MPYRADIDGLRAVAVLGVIAFHTGLGFLPGGYLGVDVFFVISGFLITRIVRRELEAGTFTYRGFYARRIRRILPALVAVSLAFLPFGWFWLMPNEFEGVGQSIVATLLFVSNFWFFIETDYFAGAAELKPFIHTWSLAIEEQFYLFFPLLFAAATRFGRRAVILLPLVLGVLSLLAAEVAVRIDASAAFYFTFFRIWEFVAGILLALTGWRAPARLAPYSGAIGLAAIVGSMTLFQADAPVPGLIGLIPILGTVLVLADGDKGLARRILTVGPLVGIGLVSYSVYLWHQPVFALTRLRTLHELHGWEYALLTLLVLALGALSWRFVEQPFRNPSRVSARTFGGMAVAACGALLAFGVYADTTQGIVWRLPQEQRAILEGHDPYARTIQQCGKLDKYPRDYSEPPRCYLGDPDAARTVHLLGDSHAAALGTALADRLQARGARVMLTYAGGCPFLSARIRSRSNERCERFRARARAILADPDPAIDTVILSSFWTYYFGEVAFDNREGAIGPRGALSGRGDAETVRAAASRELDAIIREQTALGRKVLLVHSVPEQGWDVPKRMVQLVRTERRHERPVSVDATLALGHLAPAERVLDGVADRPGLYRVRPADLFCDPALGRCLAEAEGLPLYYDDDHVNTRGAGAVLDAAPDGFF